MKKQIELTETLNFTGAGAQVPLTFTLPNSLEFDPDYYGTSYTDPDSTLLGFGDWYIHNDSWKKITVYITSSTQVRFVDNTGWIQLDQLHNQDFIKFTFKAHVT